MSNFETILQFHKTKGYLSLSFTLVSKKFMDLCISVNVFVK